MISSRSSTRRSPTRSRRTNSIFWSMADKSVGPSELKEKLRTVLKSWSLRDPETFSSWRPPLSTKSSYGSGTKEDQIGTSNLARPFELPPRIEERRKRVHLHNWGSHSANSSLSGIRSDEDFRQGPLKGDPEELLQLPVNSVLSRGTHLSFPATSYRGISINTSSSRRRAARRARRVAASRKKDMQESVISNVLDHSHNTAQSYRENRGQPTNDQAQKIGSVLHSNFFNDGRKTHSFYSYNPSSNSSPHINGRRSLNTIECWDGTTSAFRASFSPFTSEKLRRKGSTFRGRFSPSASMSKHSQVYPLLSDGRLANDSSARISSDELSSRVSEIDLESLTRFDGERFLSCRSPGPERASESDMPAQKSLSRTYRPISFDEIIGQSIVVQ